MGLVEDIEKMIDNRIKKAMQVRDERIRTLEDEKKNLADLAKSLQNDIDKMKMTIAMYSKHASENIIKKFEHKQVSCDIISLANQNEGQPNTTTCTEKYLTNIFRLKDRGITLSPLNNNNVNKTENASVRKELMSEPNLMLPFKCEIKKEPNGEIINNIGLQNFEADKSMIEFIDLVDDEDQCKISQTISETSKSKNGIPSKTESELEKPLPPTLLVSLSNSVINGETRHNALFSIFECQENKDPRYAKVESYEMFMYAKKKGEDKGRSLQSVGVVKSKGLESPTYLVASNLQGNYDYDFLARSIDIYGRRGKFSSEYSVKFQDK